MIGKMKKIYYLLFYKLYLFFKSISDDGFADWKSALVIQTLQIFGLLILFFQLILVTKNKNLLPDIDSRFIAIPIGIGLAIFNYYVFLHYRGWKAYQDEFKMYSKQKNRVINFIVFCVVFGTLSILIFTFYQLSLIDLSK